MLFNVKGTNLELTPSISDYIEKRLEGISKFIDSHSPDTVCHVEVAKTTDHHKHGDIFRAEVRIHIKGEDVYVAEEMSDLYAAIDKVRDEVMNKLSTSKDRKISLARRGGMKVKEMLKGILGKEDAE